MPRTPLNFRAFVRLVALAPLFGGIVPVPVFAATPLVLSNDQEQGDTRSSLYWDVKQVEGQASGTPPACQISKTMPDGSIFGPVVGAVSVPEIRVVSKKLSLPKTATVPVTLSFDRALPPMQATGKVEGSDRLVIAVPNQNVLYDYLGQASVLRVSVANGAAMRGVTFDLSGLKTALADAHNCLQAAPTVPMPKTSKTTPPPLPTRTPDAIAENLDGDMPDVTSAASIPPLEWPDLEGDAFAAKGAQAKTPNPHIQDMPTPEPGAVFSPPVSDVAVPPVAAAMAAPVAAPAVSTQLPAPVPQAQESAPRAQTIVVSGPAVKQPVATPTTSFGVVGDAVPPPTTPPRETYRARKGESLRDVLRRWSDRANIDLIWTMSSDIILQQDFSLVGNFEQAVSGLLAQYPESGIKTTLAANGTPPFERQPFIEEAQAPAVAPQVVRAPDLQDFTPNPMPKADRTRGPLMPYASVMDGSAGLAQTQPTMSPLPMKAGTTVAPTIEPALPVPVATTVNVAPPSPPPSVGPVRRWRALTGASVRQVIQAWAEDAGLPVLWMGNDDFAVRASVNKTSDFGGAIATLFGQYGHDTVRPVGQVYRDPQTGQSTLVVRIVK